MHNKLISLVRDIYSTNEFIPLHAPTFKGNEQAYLAETISSTFVSSVGKFVDDFEHKIQAYTGTARAVATVNGTSALHTALHLADIKAGDLVITQALTFVATCNALYHMGAEPIFIDIETTFFGLCPIAVATWLDENAQLNDDGQCIHVASGKQIKAVMPMHTFGHSVQLDELISICEKWNLSLIEDAAESLGSYYKGKHTGTLGKFGALSFNGNKVITTGGGGMLLCRAEKDGLHAKHVTTTAKQPHPYEFYHDEPGFNYRMPNLNAALGCAQMEQIEKILASKRQIASQYEEFFAGSEYQFVKEPEYAHSNYWLNAILCPDINARNALLEKTNSQGVMTRPVWQLMHRLPMFASSLRGDLKNSEFAEARLVNLPSSPTGI
ncbi:LegC family aminotransferase [Alkalimarinus sediminis]|uniref:LegC family aminotransferase n=1 Tax=Alkalimarinus sediminis TaxID=1632866 RepID=A0A9E8KPF2_9ALTE|nr:LegC family aminotransferase [Alkalimarinus sediminis]UZW73432.1 LegC family aminotransferase [Alkalimarinus sediminis]